jgi:hypothetical protein
MAGNDVGATPDNAFQEEYAGTDFDWFAADEEGNIGIFFNDSFGFVPEVVQASYRAHAHQAQELAQADSLHLVRNLAHAGLFVFAWSGQWEPYNWSRPSEPYDQIAQPTQPMDPALQARILQIDQLPVLRQNFRSGTRVSPDAFTPADS